MSHIRTAFQEQDAGAYGVLRAFRKGQKTVVFTKGSPYQPIYSLLCTLKGIQFMSIRRVGGQYVTWLITDSL